MTSPALPVDVLRAVLGDRVKANVPLAPYTSARIGGPAQYLVTAASADELAEVVSLLWQQGLPYRILGGGSNVLVSDKGLLGVTVLNRAKGVRFEGGAQPMVWAESGVVFSNLANRAASHGLGGLEWAATVPGTVGGAVYGNAGAFGGDTAGSLIRAEILSEDGRAAWPVERFSYSYRTSRLKSEGMRAAVLSAELRLSNATKREVAERIEQFGRQRKGSQPPGASMGSMFKNPPGDFAGRLIEAAGLKGARVGKAEISPLHGNFFINHGHTRAADVRALIELARTTVAGKFGVQLELEIELIGEW